MFKIILGEISKEQKSGDIRGYQMYK